MVAPRHRIDTKVRCPTTREQVTVPKTGDPFGRKQWESCRRPQMLRAALRECPHRPTKRKLRLAAVAVARVAVPDCVNDHFLTAVRCAEAIADSEPHDEVHRILLHFPSTLTTVPQSSIWRELPHLFLHHSLQLDGHPFRTLDLHFPAAATVAYLDVFANPFRQPRVLPTWRTSTVVTLAHTAYTEQAFDSLPILADALEDADCTELPLLEHLRSDGPHFRGCWAIDAILGRA
jgi:hypothetical protein